MAVTVMQLLAAHALKVAPLAVHLHLESSDQGEYMVVGGLFNAADLELATDPDPESAEHWGTPTRWSRHVEDAELDSILSFLDWHGWGWEQFIDEDDPATDMKRGYASLDLGLIVASAQIT
jgi:hypothetical protein